MNNIVIKNHKLNLSIVVKDMTLLVQFVLISSSLMEVCQDFVLFVMKDTVNSEENVSQKMMLNQHSLVKPNLVLTETKKDVQCAINLAFYLMHFVLSVLKTIC